MDDESISRTRVEMPREVFEQVLAALNEHSWLHTKSKALTELFSLCAADEQSKLLADLIDRFCYLTLDNAKAHTCSLADKMVASDLARPGITVFSVLEDHGHADSGVSVLNWLKNALAPRGFSKQQFHLSLGQAVHAVGPNSNFIFVDDFIGTGKTLTRKCEWARAALQKRGITGTEIGIVAIACMDAARSAIGESVDWVKYEILLRRGISDHVSPETLDASLDLMRSLEDELDRSVAPKKFHSLGYEQSETLYSMDGTSVPNNNFPIFWWPALNGRSTRNPLLVRAV